MIQPNIIRGGKAIPFNYNLFLMKGRKHSQGGIDVGKDLEVEGGEVMQTSPNEVRVFSAQKFLGGESPANLVLKGANPNEVFAMQEQYKQMNGINDDGTKKKAKNGLVKRFLNWIGNKDKNFPVEGENNYLEDVASRQAYAESKYDTTSVNNKNARGLFQIRPIAVDEYNRQTGDSISYESVLNPDTAIMVRNKLMDGYMNRSWINNPNNENDTVTTIKALMAYNMGDSNALQTLNKLKSDGVNIYNVESLLKNIPVDETKNYSSFIATGENQKDKLYLTNTLYNVFKNKNKDLDEKIRNSQRTKKQYGGMNNKQYNAQVLGYVPSTGRQKFASGGRKRALMGKIGETYENIFKLPTLDFKRVEDEKFNDLIKISGIKGLDIDTSKFSPLNLTENPFVYKSNGKAILRKHILGSDGNVYNSFADMPENVHPSLTGTNLLNNDNNVTNDNKPVKRKFLKNKLTDRYGDLGARYFLGNGILHGVSALTGLAGATANAISNAHYLNKMKSIVDSIKSYDIPITKLKTFYNINPQLSEAERKLGLTIRDIDANTASSQVALARKRNARYNTNAEKSKLYAQKENIETQLINQDLSQQAQTIAKNIQNRQNVEHQKAMLNMQLLDKRSENESKMLETYASILNQFANNGGNAIYNWLRYKAALAGNPNSVKAMENIV